MKILLQMDDPTVFEAARKVAFHYKDYKWLEKLRTVKGFNHTWHDGIRVANTIRDNQVEIVIRPFKSKWPWSKSIGHARGNTIWINTRKLDLPLKDRIENIMHEALHLMGYLHHGNRVTAYNLNTVPYLVANMFANYVMDKE